MWHIYSIGDAEFLTSVLTAVAMVTGSADFSSMVKMCLGLGALLTVMQGLAAGGMTIPVGRIFLSWLVYALAFGSTTMVSITNVYDGTVRTVNSVPVGIAAFGSAISRIGFSTTELMETAFSSPAMTEHGYGSSLETLKRVRIHGLTQFGLGAANSPVAGSDMMQSWVNYIKECTVAGVQTKNISTETLRRSADFMQALKFDNIVKGTQVLVGGAPQNVTCAQGHELLAAFTLASFLPAYETILTSILNLPASTTALPAIGNALSALGVTNVTAQQFVISSVLLPIYDEAMTQEYTETFRAAYATMVQDAVRARNAQWMGQQSMFDTYVRPMVTFLEAFVFAVSPILAGIIALGSFGFNVAGRYLGMLFWIQLWTPVLAIINLFLHHVVTGRFSAISAAGNPLSSMAGFVDADSVLIHWLSVGGFLAASAPALALFLVGGSIHALTQLSSRMAASENLTPEVVAPRTIARPFGRMDIAPQTTLNPTSGMHRTGSEAVLPSFSYRRENTASVESTRGEQQLAMSAFRSALGQVFTSSAQEGREGREGQLFNTSERASQSEAYRVAENRLGSVARSISQEYGVSYGQALQLAAGYSFGGGERGLRGVNVGFNGTSTAQLSESQVQKLSSDLSSRIGEDRQLSADLTRAAARDLTSSTGESWLNQEMFSEQQSVSRAAERAVQATDRFGEAQRMSLSTATAMNVPAQAAVQAVMRSPAVRQRLSEATTQAGLGAVAQRFANLPGMAEHFGGSQGAMVYAQLRALQGDTNLEQNPPTTLQRQMRDRAFGEILGQAVGSSWESPIGAGRNQGRFGNSVGSPDLPLPHGAAGVTDRGARLRAGVNDNFGEGRGRGPDIPDQHQENIALTRSLGAAMAAPTAEQIRQRESTAARAIADPGLRADVLRQWGAETFGGIWATLRAAADGASFEPQVNEHREWGKQHGLTEAQAQFYGLRGAPAMSETGEAAERWLAQRLPGYNDAYFRRLDASEVAVREEARSMGMDPDAVVGVLRHAAQSTRAGAVGDLQSVAGMNARRSESGAPGPLRDALTGSTSPRPAAPDVGRGFLLHEEMGPGSGRLHWPEGNSGVTIGPGYDMGSRSASEIREDLRSVGVSPAVAQQISAAAGLQGPAAQAFVEQNRFVTRLSRDQESMLFDRVRPVYERTVDNAVGVPVNGNERAALVSLAYNLGPAGFQRSPVVERLNAGDRDGAAQAFLEHSNPERRMREAALFRRLPEGPAVASR
ncbi:conjugal transfer protein TraG N-terminal domain-containing protein [Pseudoroseomonas sp. WGS1072]|uniref:conjugal transfer protein TraG N-terminal domain-containing protein n=1 Tax=Roseomonas sp. WGS1072 TaxID=3366816 RepID=UPI003BEF7A63